MTIQRIGVVGAGTMGNGIAQVFMQAGFDVRLIDAAPIALERARGSIEKSLGKFVEKGKLSGEDRDAAMKFAMNLGCVDSVTIGFKNTSEIDEAIERMNRVMNT